MLTRYKYFFFYKRKVTSGSTRKTMLPDSKWIKKNVSVHFSFVLPFFLIFFTKILSARKKHGKARKPKINIF